ncbi:hypothetical protein AAFF_G00390380 [Aldrovandia affinis]|uniref:Uncharacterized protein n=1 Tax=Aldrovandia affinis TaxID=143900 RepID=A0AAD7WL66_9TELE|nr:hypothetical protein AAFF_G00390380 [Aldrovandia affinis]
MRVCGFCRQLRERAAFLPHRESRVQLSLCVCSACCGNQRCTGSCQPSEHPAIILVQLQTFEISGKYVPFSALQAPELLCGVMSYGVKRQVEHCSLDQWFHKLWFQTHC